MACPEPCSLSAQHRRPTSRLREEREAKMSKKDENAADCLSLPHGKTTSTVFLLGVDKKNPENPLCPKPTDRKVRLSHQKFQQCFSKSFRITVDLRSSTHAAASVLLSQPLCALPRSRSAAISPPLPFLFPTRPTICCPFTVQLHSNCDILSLFSNLLSQMTFSLSKLTEVKLQ